MRREILTVACGLLLGCVTAAAALNAAQGAASSTTAGYETNLGGGAPSRVLAENNKLRVTLIEFPKNFTREGGLKRRADQLIVYLEPGDFKTGNGAPRGPVSPQRTLGPVTCDPIKDCGPIGPDGLQQSQSASGKPLPVGTVAWHPKDTMTGTIITNAPYRALYIELK